MIRAVDVEIRRLEAIRDQLQALASYGSLLTRKRRNLSEDGRRRIAEAQHRRWASVRERNSSPSGQVGMLPQAGLPDGERVAG